MFKKKQSTKAIISALIENNTLNSIIESKDNNILDLSNNINSLKITKDNDFLKKN